MVANSPGTFAAFVQLAFEGAEEDVAYQRTLARTRHAGDYRHYIKRDTYVHAFQVVLACACDFNILVPGTAAFGTGMVSSPKR